MATPNAAGVDELLVAYVSDPDRVRDLVEETLVLFERDQPGVWTDAELRRLAARAITASLEQFATLAQGALALEDLTLAPANAELVVAQVRSGITVEQALHLADLARTAAWENWLAALDASGASPTLRAEATAYVATETLRVTSVLNREISRLHTVERERWLRGRATRKARAVVALLEPSSRVDVAEAEERLEYRLHGVHRAAIAWREPAADAGPDALEDVARDLVGRGGLVVRVDVHAAWAWGPGETPADAVRVPDGVRLALGGAHAGVAGFRRSHREARLARRVAELARDIPAVVAYEDVALLALATQDLTTTRTFVDGVIGPLRDGGERGASLARTVRVYLEEQASPRRTAHRVGLHENTVINRIKEAEELLGRSVEERHPELLVALVLAEALEAAEGAPGAVSSEGVVGPGPAG